MSLDSAPYSARSELPVSLVEGHAQTLRKELYRDGALVAPASGTCTIYNAGGTSVASGAVTVSGDVATFAVGTSTLSGQTRGEGWKVEWALVVSGVTETVRERAQYVLRAYYPPITDADLFRRQRLLDPSNSHAITSLTNFQDFIDEADVEIQGRLLAKGNRANLVMDPSALRGPYLKLTLALVFEAELSNLNEAYADLASMYRDQFESAWGQLSFSYDTNDSGQASNTPKRRSASGTLWARG